MKEGQRKYTTTLLVFSTQTSTSIYKLSQPERI